MFTKTTMSAVRVLTYLGLNASDNEPLSPRFLAEELGESPTYLSKVVRHLVKAKILRALRGAAGGVVLVKSPEDVTLLEIVEACQSPILPDYCEDVSRLSQTCGFHRAAAELHNAIVGILSHWTLADFVRKPLPSKSFEKYVACCLADCVKGRSDA
jgi:Rrf2 family protein